MPRQKYDWGTLADGRVHLVKFPDTDEGQHDLNLLYSAARMHAYRRPELTLETVERHPGDHGHDDSGRLHLFMQFLPEGAAPEGVLSVRAPMVLDVSEVCPHCLRPEAPAVAV